MRCEEKTADLSLLLLLLSLHFHLPCVWPPESDRDRQTERQKHKVSNGQIWVGREREREGSEANRRERGSLFSPSSHPSSCDHSWSRTARLWGTLKIFSWADIPVSSILMFVCSEISVCLCAMCVWVDGSRSDWMCCSPKSEKSLPTPTHHIPAQNYHFVVEYMPVSLMHLKCVSLCECVHLSACLPGISCERHISSAPLIWMKGSISACIKKSFSDFITLTSKMSDWKSVPKLWLLPVLRVHLQLAQC